MEGLGKYAIMPELTGTIFVQHEAKALSKSYEDEDSFMFDLQKHDWKIFFQAVSDALLTLVKVQKGGYFKKNPTVQMMIIATVRESIEKLPKQSPIEQAVAINYMIEMLPLFARSRNNTYDTAIKKNVSIISDYYNRHLKKYESFNNSFLTA